MSGIFISHTHADERVSKALDTLIHDLFGEKVSVNYSTNKRLEEGIAPGSIPGDLQEHNVWTHATTLTAGIVTGDEEMVRRAIRAIRALKPTSEQLASIERGAREILAAFRRDSKIVDELRAMEKAS